MPPKSHLTALNATIIDLLIGIRLPNYVSVDNHGFAIATAASAIVLRNVKDTPVPEELLLLHLRSCTTFSFPLPNLLTTAYFSSLTTLQSSLSDRYRRRCFPFPFGVGGSSSAATSNDTLPPSTG